MRRRGLLSGPPSYLGYDLANWNVADAFDDIVVDCYVFAIAARIEGLRNQLRVRVSVDGMIVRNVDNFLLERQRRRDPIGYAVFGNLEAALADLSTSGRAIVDDLEAGRLRSASTVRFKGASTGAAPCDPARLQEAVADAPRWGETLATLVSTSNDGREWTSDFVRRLDDRGIGCFRVSDLVAAIATRAREDWAARHATPAAELAYEGDDDAYQLVRIARADESVEMRDMLAMLRRTVPDHIAREGQMARAQWPRCRV